MKSSEFLKSIVELPPVERAAAIAHRIYVLTAKRTGWEMRVSPNWAELPDSAKAYNIEAVTTWVDEPELMDAWQQALKEYRRAEPAL